MKKKLLFGLVLLAASAGLAATSVSDVTLTSNAAGNFVTVNYTLAGDDAIVTLDVVTNGVSVGGRAIRRVGGDVNRFVSAGERTIWWRPDADCDVTGDDVRAVVRTWTLDNPPDYTVRDLTGTKDRYFYTCEDALPYGIGSDVYRTGNLLLRRIPATGKTFFGGTAPTEPLRDEKGREDAYPVFMTKDYWIGVFEITQGQWEFVHPDVDHASHFTNVLCAATRPVDGVWCRELRGIDGTGKVWGFCQSMSFALGVTTCRIGECADLPNEVQWEFACRAGTSTSLYSGRWLEPYGGIAGHTLGVPDPNLCELARNEANGGRVYPPDLSLPVKDSAVPETTVPDRNADASVGTARVGSYRPNAFGLYDMLGNVFEVTAQKFWANCGHKTRYDVDQPDPPTNDADGVVCKGGNFKSSVHFCRSGARVGPAATRENAAVCLGYGFRVILPIGK